LLKDAEKSGQGVDLSVMFAKFSQNMRMLDQYFTDAKERMFGKNRKKGLFS
jgi:hypothetical protein